MSAFALNMEDGTLHRLRFHHTVLAKGGYGRAHFFVHIAPPLVFRPIHVLAQPALASVLKVANIRVSLPLEKKVCRTNDPRPSSPAKRAFSSILRNHTRAAYALFTAALPPSHVTDFPTTVVKETVCAMLLYWVTLRQRDWTQQPVVSVWTQFMLEKTSKGVCRHT